MISPERFDGYKTPARVWIHDYEHAIRSNGWSDAAADDYFADFLQKSARDWFVMDVQHLLDSNTTWDDLYCMFAEKYLTPAEEAHLQKQIDDLKQCTERMSNFIPKLMRLLIMQDPEISVRAKISAIVRKLSPKFREMLSVMATAATIAELRYNLVRI